MRLTMTADAALAREAHGRNERLEAAKSDMNAARGVMLGCMIVLVLWVPIVTCLWLLFA